MEVIDRWGEMLRSNRYVRRSWLGDDMLSRGTWSEPIIVLAPPAGTSYPDGHPCHIPIACWRGTTGSAICAAWPPMRSLAGEHHSGFVDPFATLKRFSGQILPLK
jgi:hypothetical protein